MAKSSFSCLLFGIIGFIASEKEKGLNLDFQQHDYKLTDERTELIRYNKYYVKDMSVVTFKYNRTQAVSNATFTLNFNLGNDLFLITQAYKFMSNEYRLFPLRFSANFCKAFHVNSAGFGRLMSYGNFTGCPLIKGKKHICRFYPEEEHFPPFISNGNYKVEIQGEYFSKEVFTINAFASVTRPFLWQSKFISVRKDTD